MSLGAFATAQDTICFSPINVVELAGQWTDKTHLERKAAAQAILDYSNAELPDPETFLTLAFGLPLRVVPGSLVEAVKAMAASASLGDLTRGVADYLEKVSRSVDVSYAASLREKAEGDWVRDMMTLQRGRLPKFEKWEVQRAAALAAKKSPKAPPRLVGADKDAFVAELGFFSTQLGMFEALWWRALIRMAPSPDVVPSWESLRRAMYATECHRRLYTQYLIRLMTEGAMADPNDSGDIDLSIYSICDSMLIVTSEKKWLRMAGNGGVSGRFVPV